MAAVPILGAAANTARLSRTAAKTAGKAKAARKSLRSRLGKPPRGMQKPQAHHDLPHKFRDRFEKEGIGLDIDDPRYGRWVEGGPAGNHQKWSSEFNDEWENFFEQNHKPSKEMILEKMNDLRANPRFQ